MRLLPFALSSFVFVSILSLGIGCRTTNLNNSTVKAEHGFPPEGPLSLTGRNEYILIPNPAGGYVLLHASDEMKLTELKDIPEPHIAIDSRFGNFYILSKGEITVADAKTGTIKKSISVTGENIGLEIEDENLAYLFTNTELKKISLTDGKTIATLTTPTELLTQNETHIFVAGEGEAQIIDKKTFKILNSIKLAGLDEQKAEAKLGSPLINISYQKLGNILIVTGRSRTVSSSSKGNFAEIDLKTMKLKGIFTPPTFSGARIALNKVNKLIDIQHTSTPVSSTHAYLKDITKDGKYVSTDDSFMFDMFESTNTIRVSEDQTLAITVSRCLTGFCTPGKGLIFSDLKSGARLPNFKDDEIGFLPNQAYFAYWK